jgi:hypothetical protein
MIIGFDVTQVLARKEIEKSEQSIRSLVESAPPIGVYTLRCVLHLPINPLLML